MAIKLLSAVFSKASAPRAAPSLRDRLGSLQARRSGAFSAQNPEAGSGVFDPAGLTFGPPAGERILPKEAISE